RHPLHARRSPYTTLFRSQGGVKLPDGDTIMPDPVLVGRNQDKLDELSRRSGISKTSTDLDTLLADDHYTIYFDAQTTGRRAEAIDRKSTRLNSSHMKSAY